MKILLTAVGKRVQLINHLKERLYIIGTDASDLVSSKSFVHKFYKIPKYTEEGYIDTLLNICVNEKVDCLIPLYESEFLILSKNRDRFHEVGTKLILSNSEIIDICNDKNKTYEFLKKNKISCPKVYSDKEIEEIINNGNDSVFPLIIKPKYGMGSKDIFKTNNIKELSFFKDYVEDNIVQQFINGEEFTVDVLCDLYGNYIYIVPRKRLEVRSGEVVKSSTVKDESIINETIKVLNSLNKIKNNDISIMGPLNIQFFKNDEGKVYLLEINPRFGGGVPLSFKAGADYSKALSNMIEGKSMEYTKDFKEITMLRYDEAVFLE